MSQLLEAFRGLPALARATLTTGILCGLVGGVVGLVVGIAANPGTAWFAVIELGLPSFVSGCFLGFFGGLVVHALRHRRAPHEPSDGT